MFKKNNYIFPPPIAAGIIEVFLFEKRYGINTDLTCIYTDIKYLIFYLTYRSY